MTDWGALQFVGSVVASGASGAIGIYVGTKVKQAIHDTEIANLKKRIDDEIRETREWQVRMEEKLDRMIEREIHGRPNRRL